MRLQRLSRTLDIITTLRLVFSLVYFFYRLVQVPIPTLTSQLYRWKKLKESVVKYRFGGDVRSFIAPHLLFTSDNCFSALKIRKSGVSLRRLLCTTYLLQYSKIQNASRLFVEGTRELLTSWVSLQQYVIPAALLNELLIKSSSTCTSPTCCISWGGVGVHLYHPWNKVLGPVVAPQPQIFSVFGKNI